MTLADLVIVGIIVIFAIVGLSKGLMKTLYKFVTYILALFLAFKLAKPLSLWLRDTSIYTKIRAGVVKLTENLGINVNGNGGDSFYETVKGLPFPENIIKPLSDNALANADSSSSVANSFVGSMTDVIMVILCAIILFIVLRLVFYFFGFVVEGLANIPVIKQVDRAGGLILGAAVGMIMVYIVLMLFTFLVSYEKMGWIYESIDKGVIAPYFYNNNIIANIFKIGKEVIL